MNPGARSEYGDLEMTVAEIAELEGCTPSRIRTILCVALAKLRRECEKRGLKPEDLLGHVELD